MDTPRRCECIGIGQNDGRFIQYATRWDPTTKLVPFSPPRCCKCSHWKKTLDAQLKIVRKTASSNNMLQPAIRWEYCFIEVDGCQPTIWLTAGLRKELHNQFLAAHNGKPPSSTKAFVCSARETKYRVIGSSGIFPNAFSDKHPWEWMKQLLTTLEDATERYMVEVIVESNM